MVAQTGVMMSIAALQMGKYGVYVWSCYGLTLLGLLFLVVASRRQRQHEVMQAKRRMAMAETRSTDSEVRS